MPIVFVLKRMVESELVVSKATAEVRMHAPTESWSVGVKDVCWLRLLTSALMCCQTLTAAAEISVLEHMMSITS